jgi:hypothetical protein
MGFCIILPIAKSCLKERWCLWSLEPREITPSYILHTRAFGAYLLGGYLPCKKYYKVMVFYMYTCFTILKSPILHVIFLQNLPTMNILDPIFYRTLFYDFRQVISPRSRRMLKCFLVCIRI